MKIDLPKGTYVVAVSGGVDSMVLLDLLAQKLSVRQNTTDHNVRLIVAHFDHGVRPDSKQDKQLVQQTAARYQLPFVYDEGRLGAGVSEAVARTARYQFLRRVMRAANATAIITAHHQDDLLETAIINMLRGTGRRGLSSLKDQPDILRPLLHVNKKDILAYAKKYHITWREDSTNQDESYLRNDVRKNLLSKFTTTQRQQLLDLVTTTGRLNQKIDTLLSGLLQQPTLDRHWFIMLPHRVATECLAEWLRQQGIRQFDRKLIERLVQAAKTYAPGKRADITSGHQLAIYKHRLALLTTMPRHGKRTSV